MRNWDKWEKWEKCYKKQNKTKWVYDFGLRHEIKKGHTPHCEIYLLNNRSQVTKDYFTKDLLSFTQDVKSKPIATKVANFENFIVIRRIQNILFHCHLIILWFIFKSQSMTFCPKAWNCLPKLRWIIFEGFFFVYVYFSTALLNKDGVECVQIRFLRINDSVIVKLLWAPNHFSIKKSEMWMLYKSKINYGCTMPKI